MGEPKWSQILAPYQWKGLEACPVFLYFEGAELERSWQETLYQLGFELVTPNVLQKSAKVPGFRILKIASATVRVQRKIDSLPMSVPFGAGPVAPGALLESLENYAYYEIYTLYRQALMIQSAHSLHWECAISSSLEVMDPTAASILLARYVSACCAFQQVLCFWGQQKNPKQFSLAKIPTTPAGLLAVDLKEEQVAFQRQNYSLKELEFLLPPQVAVTSKEQLFSWMASHVLYLSSGQIPKSFIQDQIYRWMIQQTTASTFRKNIDLVS